jgi:hypothetical protein
MAQVQMAGNGFGGIVQGNYGTYQAASDGTFTVDTRDAPAMLQLGMNYIRQIGLSYAVPIAAAAASIGGVVSSGALSNGTVSVTTQPAVMRPVNVEWGTGTTAITAGTVTVTYVGNDGISGSDVIPLSIALSTASTVGLSRGVDTITSITVAGLVGGTSPWIRLSTTAALSLPVSPGTVDLTVTREYDAGATIAVGSLGVSLGSVFPTTAPNGTVTYSFNYTYVSPNT